MINNQQTIDTITVDNLWVLIAAALVFFMQAGFKVLETGLVKPEHREGVGIKNLMDWVAGSLSFFIIGYGFMFGTSWNGLIGVDLFLASGLNDTGDYIFLLFQMAFAGTALTIVSGAMSGRTSIIPYFITSLITAAIIYPIFGHWSWGNLFNENNEPWLATLGFMDFAGSTVVHSIGGWVALVGVWMVGPRLGRFTAKGVIQPTQGSDYSYSILGLMILWLGWWGFNGGSTLAFNVDVPKIILNTNLAAAAGCLSAYVHGYFFQDKQEVTEKIIGGALTGLVAITACCNVVSPVSSIVIGLLAGLVHNFSYVLIGKVLKLDDPVGAIAVHGFGGVFGTLCVAIFGDAELLVHDRFTQLFIQLLGIGAAFLFSTSVAYVMFASVKYFFGLRLSPKDEKEGTVFSNVSHSIDLEDLAEQEVSNVSVRIGERAYNMFTVTEYLNLSRESRISFVKEGSVTYLDEYGNPVSDLKAVRYLAGILENQRDSVGANDLLELTAYKQNSEIIGDIRDVLLNDEYYINSIFPDSFVLYQHSESISSDFYWHAKERGYSICIIGKTPKRGLSDAFISSLVISQLNEIVGIRKVLPPEKIIKMLDEKLALTFANINRKADTNEGLDIGVLVINTDKRIAYYSGSGTGISCYFKPFNSEPVEYKGIDLPVGRSNTMTKSIERTKFEFNKGDSVYLYTNGFGNILNESGMRYTSTKFKEKISHIAKKAMNGQKEDLNNEIESWADKNEKQDDILVIGIKP
jgi:Amt family ammonium transporter